VGRYLAVLFSDLERHSEAWTRIPREHVVAGIAEYRYLAESLASQYGCLYREWSGDGHMFLFENADAAVQFGLRLLDAWRVAAASSGEDPLRPQLSLRLGCHFGEVAPLEGGQGWIGRTNSVAKRVESEAAPDSLFVTESVLDLLDLPLYEVREAGTFPLKGDALPRRTLHQICSFNRTVLAAKPAAELSADERFLRSVALIGTAGESSEEEVDFYR